MSGSTGAAITGTVVTGQMVGIREDLSGTITRIDPEECPVMSNCNTGTCSNINTDWMVQELRSPNRANAVVEGADAVFNGGQEPIRLENTCQFIWDTWIVSDTADSVNTAGRARESAYQQLLTGLSVKRDLEAIITNNQARVFTSAPRKMAGLPALCGHVVTAPGTVNTTNSVGNTAPVMPTTTWPLALTVFNDILEAAYDAGGKPEMAMMTPRLKRNFSYLDPTNLPATNQIFQTSVAPVAYIGAVSVYLSDFGRIETGMDRFMLPNTLFLLDFDYIDLLTLPGRNFKNTPLAKTGSATKGMIEWEHAARARPKGRRRHGRRGPCDEQHRQPGRAVD
jgi:hypothetical protein